MVDTANLETDLKTDDLDAVELVMELEEVRPLLSEIL